MTLAKPSNYHQKLLYIIASTVEKLSTTNEQKSTTASGKHLFKVTSTISFIFSLNSSMVFIHIYSEVSTQRVNHIHAVHLTIPYMWLVSQASPSSPQQFFLTVKLHRKTESGDLKPGFRSVCQNVGWANQIAELAFITSRSHGNSNQSLLTHTSPN